MLILTHVFTLSRQKMPMELRYLVVFLALLVQSLIHCVSGCNPPRVAIGSEPSSATDGRQQFFLPADQNVTTRLVCIITGGGQQQVEWLRNGQSVDYGVHANVRRVQEDNEPALLILAQPADDRTFYQCRSTNECGTSVSDRVELRRAFLQHAPEAPVREVRGRVGSHLVLVCITPASSPEPRIMWTVEEGDEESSEQNVVLGNRMTMDFYGNLYITRVLPEDNGKLYHCQSTNALLRSIVHVTSVRLVVNTDEALNWPMETLWSSERFVTALEGGTLKLKCIFSGGDNTRVTWSRSGGQLDASRTTQVPFELEIQNVRANDSGDYECLGISSHNTARRVTFNVQVEASPSFVDPPEDAEVAVGQGTSFSCAAAGLPHPTVRWFSNGVPLAQAVPNPRRVLNGDTLTFTNAQLTDAGVIQCNASNRHGYVYQDFALTVQECRPPSVLDLGQARKQYFISGQSTSTTLRCRANGTGTLQFQWLKNGQPLRENDQDLRSGTAAPRTVPGGQDLDLYFNTRAPRAHFQCVVSNECGTSVSDVFVMWRAFIRRFSDIPRRWREVVASAGHSATFPCNSPYANPAPQLEWMLAETMSTIPQNLRNRFIMDPEGRLHILRVRPSDASLGPFSCTARIDALRVIYVQEPMTLRVMDDGTTPLPAVRPYPVYTSPSDVIGLVGSTAKLVCIFGGNPEPEIRWEKVGGGLDFDSSRVTNRSYEVVIHDVRPSDAGQYTCTAIGADPSIRVQRTVDLSVRASPSWVAAPRDHVVGAGGNVTILCEADGVPTPTVQWYIDGQPYEESAREYKGVLTSQGLTFTHLTYSDSQVIQCNVSNRYGYVFADVFLQVIGSADNPDFRRTQTINV